MKVTLTSASNSLTKDFTPDASPYRFGNYRVSIVSVTPAPESQKRILENEYRITFHVLTVEATVSKTSAVVDGHVTLSPVCPVERMPPDPQCAPKPYQTSVEVSFNGGVIVKTIQSNVDGSFTLTLPFGSYVIEALGGNVYPRCSPVPLEIRNTKTISVDLSCDTGIR